MKRGLLGGLRALLVAICVLLVAKVMGYEIKSGPSVGLFMLFIMGLWILAERVLLTISRNKNSTKPR
jgi:Zn-dependent protease with chaperone function